MSDQVRNGLKRIAEIRLRLRVLAWHKRHQQWRKARSGDFLAIDHARSLGCDSAQPPEPWTPPFKLNTPRREWWGHA